MGISVAFQRVSGGFWRISMMFQEVSGIVMGLTGLHGIHRDLRGFWGLQRVSEKF